MLKFSAGIFLMYRGVLGVFCFYSITSVDPIERGALRWTPLKI